MPSNQDLMELHVEALFTHDLNGRLLAVNDVEGGPAPRFFLGRTATGNVWRFRADVPAAIVAQVDDLCANEPIAEKLARQPHFFETFRAILQSDAPVRSIWMGPAYRVPVESKPQQEIVSITHENADLLNGGFEWLMTTLDDEQPCVAIVRGGRAVSICRSVRITARAHEAGLETLRTYRGRGYAMSVVTGWAAAVHTRGSMPLYSTSWENLASQQVAKKLGLTRYGVTFHIT